MEAGVPGSELLERETPSSILVLVPADAPQSAALRGRHHVRIGNRMRWGQGGLRKSQREKSETVSAYGYGNRRSPLMKR